MATHILERAGYFARDLGTGPLTPARRVVAARLAR
jgi:hypothetical protein